MTKRRRTRADVRKSFPTQRSRQSHAPAAHGDRRSASCKQGRAATARAAARRKLRAAVIGVAVVTLVTVGVLAFGGGGPTAGAVINPAAFSLPALSGTGGCASPTTAANLSW